MNDLIVVISLIFLAATLAFYGVYWVFVLNRREQKIINRRLELSANLADPSAVLTVLRQERGFNNVSNPILRRASDWLTQTGTEVRWSTYGVALVVVFVLIASLFSAFLGFGLTALVIALICAAAVVFWYLNRQRSRRIYSFTEQLPDAIDIITRGVRVGLPFSSAVSLVAREMPDPIGTEFGMLGDEMTFGLDQASALENLHRRVGQEDLLFLTVAATIQTQTGGNLGDILSRLSKLLRSRANMRLKVGALSAEGRFSAIILSALPFTLLVIINFIAPKYYAAVLGNPIVEPAIYVAIAMLLLGNFIMYRMVHFKY